MKRGSLVAKLAGLRSARTQLLNQMRHYENEGNTSQADSYRERVRDVETKIAILERQATASAAALSE